MDPILLVVEALGLLLYFAICLWMLLDAVRRGRGWVRWQVLLCFLTVFVAAPVWFVRRRRWPATVEITRARRLKFAALATGIAVANLFLAPALASAVATHVFQIARMEGRSMSPMLNDQDRVILNKRGYRMGDPVIGDMAMFRYPPDPSKSFVKRVVASGGDKVWIVNGVLFRNGGRVDEPYVLEANRSHEDWGPEVVPEGAYFVLGDHRNNSADSRIFGFVARQHMVGRVAMRWWPLSARRRF